MFPLHNYTAHIDGLNNDTILNDTNTWEDFNITCREDFYELIVFHDVITLERMTTLHQ